MPETSTDAVTVSWKKENTGKQHAENFAYVLSKALPKATVIADRAQVNSGKGLSLPAMYQNGVSWDMRFPGKFLTGMTPRKLTVYPGWL
jgi:hypothetical protein